MNPDTWTIIEAVSTAVAASGTVLTAVAVYFTIKQVKQNENQERTEFEDKMCEQYRQTISPLPVEVFFGIELQPEKINAHMKDFFRYFDLTNEQITMHNKKLIRKETWAEWLDGIRWTMRLPAFAASWKHIKEKVPDCFHELRVLENSDFAQ